MSDPKIVKLQNRLNLKKIEDFRLASSYSKVFNLLKTFAPSTSEDYIWRLHRELATIKDFPKKMLQKYYKLLLEYKKLYPN